MRLVAALPETIKTHDGLVSGVTLSSGVRAFKGIPFAAPPVGPLRWKEPQPVAKWEGVRKADTFSNVCVQPQAPKRVPVNVAVDLPDSPKMSEDCLYLNIWTSAKSRQRQAAGDVLDLRWRIFGRRRIQPAQRRRYAGPKRRGAGHLQLPAWRVRVLLASRVDERIGPQRVRQPGAGGFDRGACVGYKPTSLHSVATRTT